MTWSKLAQFISFHEHRPGPWMAFFNNCDSSDDFAIKLDLAIRNSSRSDVQATLGLIWKLYNELKANEAMLVRIGGNPYDPRYKEIRTSIEFSEALIEFFQRYE